MGSKPEIEGASDRSFCPESGHIQTGYFRGFKSFIKCCGRQYTTILDRYNIDASNFEEFEYHMESDDAASMLEECSYLYDDPYFGIRLAQHQDTEIFGSITTIARSAPDFRTALDCFVEFLPVLNSPEGATHLVIGRDVAEFRWHSTSDLCPQANQHGLLLFFNTLKMLGGQEFKPSYVNLRAGLTKRQNEAIEQRVGCSVWKSDTNAIGFSATALRQPLASRNNVLFYLLRSRLRDVSNKKLCAMTAKVEGFVRKSLPGGSCRIEDCADEIGVSVRTLQRRLFEEGQNFSMLVEKQRIRLARYALRQTNDSLADIALTLGYFDQTSFCRAFRRWSDTSPGKYRNSFI